MVAMSMNYSFAGKSSYSCPFALTWQEGSFDYKSLSARASWSTISKPFPNISF